MKTAKRALCLVFAFLLSINSFAAIVSDNDGAAFITKAEFDSMKNNFQKQLNEFNSSIDNKLDGAISSYLSGVKQSKIVKNNIINEGWDECTAVSGVFANIYQIPDIDFLFILNYYFKINKTNKSYDGEDFGNAPGVMSNEYEGNLGHVMRLTHSLDWSGKVSKRNLVVCTGNEATYGDLIWAGRAIKYKETINVVKHVATWLGSSNAIGWFGYFDRPDIRSYTCTIRDVSTFKKNGRVVNWKDEANIAWPIKYIWKSGSDYTNNITWSSEKEQNSLIATIDLLPDDNGNTTEYDHIISYRNNSTWRLSNQGFTKRFRVAADNAVKSSSLYNASTKTNTAKGFSTCWFGLYQGGSGNTRSAWPIFWGELPVSHEITDDSIVSSVGMLDADVSVENIYQDNDRRIITTNNFETIKDRPTLQEGMQLLVNKKDTKITWEPKFNYTHVHNGASTYVDNNHEVDLYFSLSPFGDKLTPIGGSLIKVKVNGADDETDFATTVGRTCKVEFKMPDSGLVYVKWVPHETTYIDNDWLVTLDIENCNTYTYEN